VGLDAVLERRAVTPLGRKGMKATFWFLAAMLAGCTNVTLNYGDWQAPADGNWVKDSYECDRDAREAYLRPLPGQRQRFADRCLIERGYVRR
jgi:hypothetical protein